MKKRKQSKGTHEERYNRCLLFKINNAVLNIALVLRLTIKNIVYKRIDIKYYCGLNKHKRLKKSMYLMERS